MDSISRDKRTRIMKSIKSSDTKPEIALRKFLFSKGIRYRINYKKLPGKPDIVIVKNKIAVFVHGCFWHQHKNCKITNSPSSNKAFWDKKFKENIKRDKNNLRSIYKMGWVPIVIWECEILDINRKVRDLNPIKDRILRIKKI